jgi:hypothetical protein
MVTIKKVAQYALFSDDRTLDILIESFLDENQVLKIVPMPDTQDQRTLSVAAGLIELLAVRSNQEPPDWSASIGEMPEPFYIRKNATKIEWLKQQCLLESPEPLKKRKIYATWNFLSFV